MGIVHNFVIESSHSFWTKFHREFGRIQEHELRGNSEFIQYHTEICVLEHSEEILTVKTIESTSPSWTRSTLSHDQVIQWTEAKGRVYSDSVPCLVKMSLHSEAIGRWEGQVVDFQMSAAYGELLGIDGEALEFEWNIFPGFTPLQILQEFQNKLQKRNIELEKFTDRIIFTSMFTDIDWTRNGNDENCISDSEIVKMYAKRFSQGHRTFLRLGDEKKRYGNRNYKPEGKWNSVASQMVQTIQGNRSSSLYKCQCFESWSSENAERKRNHTLQCGCFKHKTIVPNHSFCKSAQCLRSSRELVWAIRFNNGREGTRTNSRKRRIREPRNTKERVFTRNELTCLVSFPRSEIVSGNRLRENIQDFGSITVRDCSVHKGSRTRIVLVPGIGWYELQDQTWRGGRFWRNPFYFSENTHVFEQTHYPELSPQFLGGTIIGQVIEVHVVHLFGTHGLEIEIPFSEIIQNGHLGFWYLEEKVNS